MRYSVRIATIVSVGLVVCSCNRQAMTLSASNTLPTRAIATAATVHRAVPAATAANLDTRTAAAAALDPEAVKALDRMGTYLRTLTAFQIASDTTLDEVLEDGQQIEYGGHVDMIVQRPNRFRAELTSDRQQRFFFYDGKSFTLWARRVNFYATVPAPPTLAELGDRLQAKYGIEMPLTDLFYWGSDGSDDRALNAAADIGASQIQGVSCEHYAYRQADVDWQVWIQQGSYPLPRKLVITTTSEAARPQYTSVMTWNLAPSFNDAAFTFDPPAEAHKITLGEQGGGSSPR
jgi:hypothetical protein